MTRKVLVSALLAGVALAAHSGTASADRKMLVLVDASGSMTTLRSDSVARYDAAIARSDSMILNQAMMGLDGVAIYTFSDSTATQRTAGFVDVNTARDVLLHLNDSTPEPGTAQVYVPPGGVTPLAGSMCDAIDALVANTTASDIRIMQLSSDGEENATDPLHACFGPFSSINVEPFEAGSWQNKVYLKAVTPQPGETDATVNVRVDLFNYTPVTGLLASAFVVAEAGPTTVATRPVARKLAAAAASQAPTLEEFFGKLAQATGGELHVIDDNMALPVEGDISDDGCVDFFDTLQVAVRFGQKTPAVDGKFDRDADGTVTFNDYLNVLAHVTPECVANSHVVAENLHCKGSQTLTVDGKFIDDAATTITAYGSCKLTIKNSIIVAGGTALKIYGAARVKIENSHVISANTLVDLWGAAFVSAKNSSLKGQVKTTGAVVFQDLGGNTWY
jgi:hypothetical protein